MVSIRGCRTSCNRLSRFAGATRQIRDKFEVKSTRECPGRSDLKMWRYMQDYSDSLDIVIPAYKARFLPALLQSLSSQTSKRFAVIVSDDASPEYLEPICADFAERLHIRYVRFERNLGATDLAAHWNRSVGLSDARWVLLPGDDDALEENCIESFWNTNADSGGTFEVFSFGVRVVDENDSIIRNGICAAASASATQYLRQRFAYQISPVPAAYVFSRESFSELGGFVSFDHGWHSDEATWALLGARSGIKPIPNAFIRWRVSDINISPTMARDNLRSVQATLAFLSWIDTNSARLKLSKADVRDITNDSISWSIYDRMARVPNVAWLPTVLRTANLLHRYGSISLARHIFRFARARLTSRQALRGSGNVRN